MGSGWSPNMKSSASLCCLAIPVAVNLVEELGFGLQVLFELVVVVSLLGSTSFFRYHIRGKQAVQFFGVVAKQVNLTNNKTTT